jgi:hypothetical protein
MSFRPLITAFAVLVLTAVSAGGNETDVIATVRSAARNAATVGTVIPPGKTGRTVVLLEESHDSLASQLELAAVLVRLHAAGLSDVVLEGYLKNAAGGATHNPVSREWFGKAAGTLSPDIQRETAARLLREGEISAAEFFFLAYPDTRLLPAETPEVRGGDYSEQHASAAMEAIAGVADAVLRNAAAKGAVDVQKFNGLATKAQGAKDDEAKSRAAKELMDYIATLDPWLKSAYGLFTDANLITRATLADRARVHEELIVQANKWGVKANEVSLRGSAQFLGARHAANEIMVASTVATNARLVALNIGAAHTTAIAQSLAAKGFGVIVITPLSMLDPSGRLDSEQFSKKHALRSVFSAGQILHAVERFKGRKKPEPTLNQPWLQAKGELYLFVSRLTRAVLAPPAPPGDGRPPFGFDDGDFRGRLLFIDPREVQYLPTPPAILFPVRSQDQPDQILLWVKSAKSDMTGVPVPVLTASGTTLAPAADADRLASLLLAYRDAVKARNESPRTTEDRPLKAGSDVDLMRVDLKTVAAFGTDKAAVAAATVSAS